MKTFALSLLLFLAALPARSDTLLPFAGTITISGPSVVETIDVSFDFTWIASAPYLSQPTWAISSLEVTSNGPLNFTGQSGTVLPGSGLFGYRPLFDGVGDELDLLEEVVPPFDPLNTTPAFSAGLYTCPSQQCVADFGVEGCAYSACGGPVVTSDIALAPTNTPEPSTFMFLLAGLGILIARIFLGCSARSAGAISSETRPMGMLRV